MSISSWPLRWCRGGLRRSSAFGVISDNIANANTIGYKESEARFSTLVTRTTTQSAFSPGGVVARPISNAQQQGLLQASSSGTDLAIDGNGFFVVNAAAVPGDNDQYSLTAPSSFNPDENGRLVNTATISSRATSPTPTALW